MASKKNRNSNNLALSTNDEDNKDNRGKPKENSSSLLQLQKSVNIGRNSSGFKKRDVKAQRINELRSLNGDESKKDLTFSGEKEIEFSEDKSIKST